MSSCKYRLTHAPDHSKPHFLFCCNNFHYCQHSQYHILRIIFKFIYTCMAKKNNLHEMDRREGRICAMLHCTHWIPPKPQWQVAWNGSTKSRNSRDSCDAAACTCEKKREAKKPRQQSDREKETLRAHIYANSQSVEPIEPASTAHRTLKNERAKKQSQKSARCIKLGAQHITRRRRRVSKKAAAAAWPCRERLWREA